MSAVEGGLARALALVNSGHTAQAESLCQALLLRDASHPAVHQLMAVLRAQQGRWQEAQSHVELSLSARPDHLPSLELAARIARATGDTSRARGVLQQIADLQPASPHAWFALALACHDAADRPGERAGLQRVLQLQPGHVEALVNRGIAQQEDGDLAAAMHSYAQAWRLRADTLGRIANALCSERTGALWLDMPTLQAALSRLSAPA